LRLVAAFALEKGDLGRRLDALGDDAQAEAVAERDDRARDRRVVPLGR
jgi:hypothetical protein